MTSRQSTMLSEQMLELAASGCRWTRLGSVQVGATVESRAALGVGALLRLLLRTWVTLKLTRCGLLLVLISMPLGPRL